MQQLTHPLSLVWLQCSSVMQALMRYGVHLSPVHSCLTSKADASSQVAYTCHACSRICQTPRGCCCASVTVATSQTQSHQNNTGVHNHKQCFKQRPSTPQVLINPSEEPYFNLLSACSNTEDLNLMDVRCTSDVALTALAKRMSSHKASTTKAAASSLAAATPSSAPAAAPSLSSSKLPPHHVSKLPSPAPNPAPSSGASLLEANPLLSHRSMPQIPVTCVSTSGTHTETFPHILELQSLGATLLDSHPNPLGASCHRHTLPGSLSGQDDAQPSDSFYSAIPLGNQQPQVHAVGMASAQCHAEIPSMSTGSRTEGVGAVKQEGQGGPVSELEAGAAFAGDSLGVAQTLQGRPCDGRCAGIT